MNPEAQKHQEQVWPRVENIPKSPDQVAIENNTKTKKLSKSLSNSDIDISTYSPNLKKLKEEAKKDSKKLGDIIHPKVWNEKSNSNKLEWIKTIDWKEFTTEKLKTFETRELLKMEVSDRLNLVTKGWKIERWDLKEWKEIEFNFSADWEKNKNLYLNTSAGQVLPVEIGTVNVGWVEYQRHWYEWEFFNEKWERLLIDDWTKITIWKPRTNEDLKWIVWKMKEDGNKLIADLNIDVKKLKEWDKEKLDIIRESLKKWLSPNEVKTILDWKYEDLSKITPESRKKEVFKVLMDLKNHWVLDWDTSWDKIDRKSLETFIKNTWIWEISYWNDWYPTYTGGSAPDMSKLEYPEWTPEQTKEMLSKAMWELWTHENSWKADKYFDFNEKFKNLNARSTPWCAAFVNWALKEWWLPTNWSLAAKSFIQWSWKWHVWFKVWEQLLWWNQSNRVSLKPLNVNNVEWWVMPHKMNEIHGKWSKDFKNIPNWAIVVFGRGKNTT